jgi:hypothetical protein
MPWIAGGLALYLVLAVTLGVLTFRRGHLVLFVVGFVLPLLWLVGAVVPAAPGHGTGRAGSAGQHPEHHGRVTVNPD